MNEQEMMAKKARTITTVRVILFLLTGFVVAPFILIAVKGVIGLVLAGIVGLFVINIAPVVAEMAGNWRIKAIQAEAARNPIETLERDYAERIASLGQFKASITAFAAAVMTFADKMDNFRAHFPQDSDKFEGNLAKMKKLLALRRERYKEAEASVRHYSDEIDRAKAIWQMGLEAAKMNKAAGMTDEDFMAKIKVETALDSVTTSMNTAFAELETSLIEEDDEKKVLQIAAPSVNGQIPKVRVSEKALR